MGIRHAKTLTLRGEAFNETRAKVIQDLAIPQSPQQLFDPFKAVRKSSRVQRSTKQGRERDKKKCRRLRIATPLLREPPPIIHKGDDFDFYTLTTSTRGLPLSKETQMKRAQDPHSSINRLMYGYVNHESKKIPKEDSKEGWAPRENKNREPVRRNVTVETTDAKALVAQDGIGNFMPPKPDLILADVDEYVVSESVTSVLDVATNEAKTSQSKPKSVSEPLIKDWVSNRNLLSRKSIIGKPNILGKTVKVLEGNPQQDLQKKEVIDSGCSRLYTNDDWNEVKQILRMELRLTLAYTYYCQLKVNAASFGLLQRTRTSMERHRYTPRWMERSTIASAIICLAINQKFNFSEYILDSMVKHLDNGTKFLMYPRVGKDFSRRDTPLFPAMLVPDQEDELGEETVVDEAVNKEMHDSLERATTTATSLDAEHDRGGGPRRQDTMRDTITQTRSENVSKQSNDPHLLRVNTLGSGEDSLKLNELMELCTKLSERVLNLETTKTTQEKEISSLKRRVKRLEKKRRSRTYRLKRSYKIGLSARVESSAKEPILDKENASKHGRNIADIDADADTILVDETTEDHGRYDDQEMFNISVLDDEEEVILKEAQDVQNVVKKVIEDITTAGIKETVSTVTLITTINVTPDELTMAQALVEIKKSKPKSATTTTKTVTIPTPDSTRPKTRGVVMQKPGETLITTIITKSSKVQEKGKGIMVEEPLKMKKKDQISFDEQEARRLQAEFDEQDKLAEEKAQLIEDENLAWEYVQAMMDADYELAARLHKEEQGELTIKEKSRLFMELMDKRKTHFEKLRAEEKRRKPPTKAQIRNQ
nr:hypothetical protein [Tanacetum cinerariifolium]